MQQILSNPNVKILWENEENIIELRWFGNVTFENALSAHETIKSHLKENCSIIVNRSALESFEAEARSYLKTTFIRQEAKLVIPFVSRLATVESKDKFKIFSVAFNQLISVVFPNLKMKSFNRLEDAHQWINEDKKKEPEHRNEEVLDIGKSKASVFTRISSLLFS